MGKCRSGTVAVARCCEGKDLTSTALLMMQRLARLSTSFIECGIGICDVCICIFVCMFVFMNICVHVRMDEVGMFVLPPSSGETGC